MKCPFCRATIDGGAEEKDAAADVARRRDCQDAAADAAAELNAEKKNNAVYVQMPRCALEDTDVVVCLGKRKSPETQKWKKAKNYFQFKNATSVFVEEREQLSTSMTAINEAEKLGMVVPKGSRIIGCFPKSKKIRFSYYDGERAGDVEDQVMKI